MPQRKIVTVFGATGFVGRHVVQAFARAGWVVRAVSRHAQKAYFLKPCGEVGQIVPVEASADDPHSVEAVLRGAQAVVYLPGILSGRAAAFRRVHVDYPAQIAEACARLHVPRYVHISALGCDRSVSFYAQTKRAGEQTVASVFPRAVIFRPSIIFGPEDGFFGRFAQMARFAPALPLIGGGRTRFQPVYAGDVAQAVVAAATLPSSGPQNPEGRVYELGGPDIYSFKALLQMMFPLTGVSRPLIPVPFALATVKAFFLQMLPVPPLTVDQVRSLKTDNIVASGSFGLADLGIAATPLAGMLPALMMRYRAGGPAASNRKVF